MTETSYTVSQGYEFGEESRNGSPETRSITDSLRPSIVRPTLPDGTTLQLGNRTFAVDTNSATNNAGHEQLEHSESNPLSWTAGQHVTVSLKFPDPTAALSIADASANENASHLLFEVTLSRALRNTVKVDFETTSGGTATEDVDYHARRTYTHVILAGNRTRPDGLRAH